MNATHFDDVIRSLTAAPSRRMVLGLTLGGWVGALGIGIAAAKNKQRKKKKKKITRNEFGCVDVGKFCKNASQCCSGTCVGKRGKKRCLAHDSGTCQPGQRSIGCGGDDNVSCTTNIGTLGDCVMTTGNAPYCNHKGDCTDCKKDADCVGWGPGSACVVCAALCPETGGKYCASNGFLS